jgi:prefoldin beta subunit
MKEEEAKELFGQLQNLQQQMQTVVFQKESLKLHNMEIDKAMEELNNTKQPNAFKITGQIMVSKPVEEIKKELTETKEEVDLKLKSLEKSEERINNKLKELQTKLKEVMA